MRGVLVVKGLWSAIKTSVMMTDTPIKVKRRRASTVALGDLPVRYPYRIAGFNLRSRESVSPGKTILLFVVLLTVFLAGVFVGMRML